MTIKIRRSTERGRTQIGWLDSNHTFSFGDYYDPSWEGFHNLRVINEDIVEPGNGFGAHPHSNMEILSYIVEGELAHKDSMGNVKTVKQGEVQAMSAGTGVTHSEFNPSNESRIHFLQIWIIPNRRGITPQYSEWKPSQGKQQCSLIASPDGRDGSIVIQQDATVSLLTLKDSETFSWDLAPSNVGWIQIIKGQVAFSGVSLSKGDGAGVEQEGVQMIESTGETLALLFNL